MIFKTLIKLLIWKQKVLGNEDHSSNVLKNVFLLFIYASSMQYHHALLNFQNSFLAPCLPKIKRMSAVFGTSKIIEAWNFTQQKYCYFPPFRQLSWCFFFFFLIQSSHSAVYEPQNYLFRNVVPLISLPQCFLISEYRAVSVFSGQHPYISCIFLQMAQPVLPFY